MTLSYATWLGAALRNAGLTVVEEPGWKTRGHRDYSDLIGLVWHHDASPPGDSPGTVLYMLNRWDHGDGVAAQCWVSRQGVWHLLGAGVAWHAGAVLPGKLDNHTSIGVETDHTSGEAWPPALLNSLRLGTAAVLTHLGRSPALGLDFHKTICAPPGRKSDPDGLDLAHERAAVATLMAHGIAEDTLALTKDVEDRFDALDAAVDALKKDLDAERAQNIKREGVYLGRYIDEMHRDGRIPAAVAAAVEKVAPEVDKKALVDEVLNELAAGFTVSVTPKE
jgi:hypothetical protein